MGMQYKSSRRDRPAENAHVRLLVPILSPKPRSLTAWAYNVSLRGPSRRLPLRYRLAGSHEWDVGVPENISRSGTLFYAEPSGALVQALASKSVLDIMFQSSHDGADGPTSREPAREDRRLALVP